MTTPQAICSDALAQLGSPAINALDGARKGSRLARDTYYGIKRELLANGFWTFNQRAFVGALKPEAPKHPKWEYAFGYPPDCLGILGVTDSRGDNVRYDIFGQQIYRNEREVRILYKTDLTEDSFPAAFRQALVQALVARWSGPITRDDNTVIRTSDAANIALKQAQHLDRAQLESVRLVGDPRQSRLIRARNR